MEFALIFLKLGKMSTAAVMIGALSVRYSVNLANLQYQYRTVFLCA